MPCAPSANTRLAFTASAALMCRFSNLPNFTSGSQAWKSSRSSTPSTTLVAAGGLLVSTTLLCRYLGLGGQYQVVGLDFGVSLLSAWLVGGAANGFGGVPGALLASSPAVAVGKISYGLYVYHFLAIHFGWLAAVALGLRFDVVGGFFGTLGLSLIFCIAMSAVSYQLLERPFLKMKQRLTIVTGRTI